jgi:hypothetical protein
MVGESQATKGINILALSSLIIIEDDALLSSLLDPREGLGMVNFGKLELGDAPDF